MTTKRVFVLLSGGIDSTVCLHKALAENDVIEAISVHYGQRHSRELDYASRLCRRFHIRNTELRIPTQLWGEASVLTNREPTAAYDISADDTYVPFRNGVIISMAVTHAQKWVAREKANNPNPDDRPFQAAVYYGANAQDTQPDCSSEFIGAMANAVCVGTHRTVRLHTPLQWLSKTEVIMLGERLHVSWENTYSCYLGQEQHCGVCPTCRVRRTAFHTAGVSDPTVYTSN